MRYVYILRSLSQSRQLYIGVTRNVAARLKDHNEGQCAHTSKFRPWSVVYVETYSDQQEAEALARERQLKRWSRGKKEALIIGDNEALRQLARCKRKVT